MAFTAPTTKSLGGMAGGVDACPFCMGAGPSAVHMPAATGRIPGRKLPWLSAALVALAAGEDPAFARARGLEAGIPSQRADSINVAPHSSSALSDRAPTRATVASDLVFRGVLPRNQ